MQPIVNLLEEWISKGLIGKRSYETRKNPNLENEFIFIISIEVTVSVGGNSRLITKQRYFFTQTVSNSGELNPDGDRYLCSQIINQLEAEFLTEYTNFVNTQAEILMRNLGLVP